MEWFGAGAMSASALAGLLGLFVFGSSRPLEIGPAVFFFIGLIALAASGERKRSFSKGRD